MQLSKHIAAQLARTAAVSAFFVLLLADLGACQNITNTPSGSTLPDRVELTWEGIFVMVMIGLMILGMAFEIFGSLAALFLTSTIFALTGIISSKELFLGFVNKGMLVIALMFVIVHPISNLPAARQFVTWLLRPKVKSPEDSTKSDSKGGAAGTLWPRAKLCLFGWVVSPFLENVPHVAVITPVVTRVCREFNLAPSLMLLPMAYSVCTANFFIIGSASNLIIQSLQEQQGHEAISFFELVKTNAPVSLILQFYFVFAAPLFLRVPRSAEDRVGKASPDAATKTTLAVTTGTGDGGDEEQNISDLIARYTAAGIAGAHDTVAMLGVPAIKMAAQKKNDAEHKKRDSKENVDASAELVAGDGSQSAPVVSPTSPAPDASRDGLREPHPVIGLPLARALEHVPDAVSSRLVVIGMLRPVDEPAESTEEPYETWEGSSKRFHSFSHDADVTIRPRDILVLLGRPEVVRSARHLGSFAYVGVGMETSAVRDPDGRPSVDSALTAPIQWPLPKGLVAVPISRSFAPFALVIVAEEAHGVGERLGSLAFCSHYNCSILSCRTRHGETLAGMDLVMHILEPGDKLVIRTVNAFLTSHTQGPSTEFYMVDPLSFSLEPVLQDKYIKIPMMCAPLCHACSARLISRGDGLYFRLPNWWDNLTALAFFAVVAVAMAGEDLLLACATSIIGMVLLGIVTVRQAVNYVEWNVYVTGSMAFGIGYAMTNSGLALWLGQQLTAAGLEGYWMMFVLALLTSLIGNIVSNRGAIQVMFPIAVAIVNEKKQDLLPYTVTIANAAMGGFITPYGLSPSLIVAGPGDYTPRDFIVFGTPLLILYTFLSALMTSLVYDFW